MYFPDLFAEALREPRCVITYHVSRFLAELDPGRAMVEGEDCDFDLSEFAEAGRCSCRRLDQIHAQINVRWSNDRGTQERPRNAWFEVEWEGHAIDVVVMDWDDRCWPYHWILADSQEVARAFHAAVCAFDVDLTGEVLVFDDGYFRGSPGLHDQIGPSTAANLVLPPRFKADLFADVDRFFASKSAYDRMNVPWKRGLLLLGPPGNGKTHAIKALIQATGRPSLYVKTFRSEDRTEASNIRRVFERARRVSPCILVLEDLDSLVTPENRSFFLNEMDGFAANTGILTVATTNHPKQLDPAILDRPSRFDRKYHFPLPAEPERLAFICAWADTLDLEVRPSAPTLAEVAGGTEGFSFAYLKELFLSSTMAWIAEDRPLESVLRDQVEVLVGQMRSTEAAALDSPA